MNVRRLSPRRLARQWLALLLPPVAWAVALGAMFSATDEACTRDSHGGLWTIVGICALLAISGAPLAWRERRAANQGDLERARFMMEVALGLSALFSIVVIMNAIPLLMLGPCRT